VIIPPYNLHFVCQDFNIRKPLCRTNIFADDCFNRCVSALNSLPSVIVNSMSVAAFKRTKIGQINRSISTFKRALGSVNLSFFKLCLLVLLSNYYALCIHLRVIIVIGVTLALLDSAVTKECATVHLLLHNCLSLFLLHIS